MRQTRSALTTAEQALAVAPWGDAETESMQKHEALLLEEEKIFVTPECVTIHGSHPAFGLLHQTERELCRVRAEADGLRGAVDELTATIRKLKATSKKLKDKK